MQFKSFFCPGTFSDCYYTDAADCGGAEGFAPSCSKKCSSLEFKSPLSKMAIN